MLKSQKGIFPIKIGTKTPTIEAIKIIQNVFEVNLSFRRRFSFETNKVSIIVYNPKSVNDKPNHTTQTFPVKLIPALSYTLLRTYSVNKNQQLKIE
ncbi:hypothetical protein [Neobacillus drentensis]|uniref:hypothetical protein n=1 Tax=Neobacillus drentensis TaxID=220684 RepID=UPI0012FAC0FE|nr:hypothetical protein [Neobacillus drentensis]